MKNFIVISVILLVAKSYPQDSLFIWPSGKEIEIFIDANVMDNNFRFRYNFLVNSGLNSVQNVDDFYVEFGSDIDSILSPDYWLAGISSVWTNVLMWSSRDTLYNILPGNSLSGFSYSSFGLPSIKKYYGVGYYTLPSFNEGEAPDASEIVGGGILENSVQGYTIGASSLPDPFIPLNFLDTLINYNQRSLELGWIINQATANKYDSLFITAKTLLEGNHIPWIEYTLQSVLEECNEDSSGNITSEAYALLRYNTEYLLENLPEVIPPVLNSISPGIVLRYVSGGIPPIALIVTATGANFSDSSIAYFNGNAKATTIISDSVLTFPVTGSEMSALGNYPVWISTYGSNSDTLTFSVTDNLPQSLTPTLQCVRNNGGGSYTAYFGYNNNNSVSAYVPLGSKNKFTPTPIDRGQPKLFLTGTHTNVFSVNFSGKNLTWTLGQSSVTANSNSTPCP